MNIQFAMQVTLVREPVTHRNVNAQELAEHMIQAGAFEAKFVAMRQVHKTDCCSRSAESGVDCDSCSSDMHCKLAV